VEIQRCSQSVLDNWRAAFVHVCQSRKTHPSNADIWDLRFHWGRMGDVMLKHVLCGTYRLSPMLVVGRGSESQPLWTSRDAVVLKFLALELQAVLPAHSLCSHVKGHGGVYGSVFRVGEVLRRGSMKFVFRTDIRGYYENIRKTSVMDLGRRYIDSPAYLRLYSQYVHYSVESKGLIYTPRQGICRGCSLSPMIGASLLWHMDQHYEAACSPDFFYTRYMDDFLFLSTKRWPLRRAIAWLCEQFSADGFQRHPDKTTVGRIDKGFDWLGGWFSPDGCDVSPRSRAAFQARLVERAQRHRRYHVSEHEIEVRLEAYKHRRLQWQQSFLKHARGEIFQQMDDTPLGHEW